MRLEEDDYVLSRAFAVRVTLISVEPLFLVYGSIQMKIVDLARPIKRKRDP